MEACENVCFISMAARIHLVRHGVSAHVHDGSWKDSTLLAVTHGGFRRFLWATLVDRGWTPEFRRKAYHNWSVWSFRGP